MMQFDAAPTAHSLTTWRDLVCINSDLVVVKSLRLSEIWAPKYNGFHAIVSLQWLVFCLNFILGDGGNDVSMIQAADAGVGIEGKVRENVLSLTKDQETGKICLL